MKKFFIVLAIFLSTWDRVTAEPLYPNSVASNSLDFITNSDPHAFHCLEYDGLFTREMPKGPGGLFQDDTFVFTAQYTDGTSVGLWAHPSFGTFDAAEELALQLTEPIGKLPTFMRSEIDHVVILPGDGSAFAQEIEGGGFFAVYADNMATRIANHDLEETVFHESVHVALDVEHANSAGWLNAKALDGDLITEYAENNPGEDLAESALFAWAMTRHPGRLPADVEASVRGIMPNRLAYLDSVLNSGEVFTSVGPMVECQSVPEPSAAVLVAPFAMLLVMRFRKRRR